MSAAPLLSICIFGRLAILWALILFSTQKSYDLYMSARGSSTSRRHHNILDSYNERIRRLTLEA